MWTFTAMLFYSAMQNSSKTWQRRWQKVDKIKPINKFKDYVRSVFPSHAHIVFGPNNKDNTGLNLYMGTHKVQKKQCGKYLGILIDCNLK